MHYTVKFAHQDNTKPDLHGWGTMEITTDLPITTEEQKLEVARSIGRAKSFTSVAVLEIIERR
jgi:hypothetical protein